MGIRQSSKRTLVCIFIPCVAFGLLRLAVAPSSTSASETSLASSVSPDLRQRAKILRPADHGIGRYIADASFLEIDGKQHSLSEFNDRKLVVVAMTSTSCPLSKKYLPTLVELAKKYSAQGVEFIAVNCVPTDNADAMQSAAKSLGAAALYVHDADEILARQVGAMTTTDVLVLDPARTVVYHGAIDDQYGIGYALEAPRHTFLATALDALLAGKTPEISATAAPGCTLDHETVDSAATATTYHNRISRIVQQNCIECHRTGGVGPFPLETYADVVAHAPMIRDVIERGSMPPWFAAKPEAGHASIWANDRSLSEADKIDMTTWIKGSRTEGDASDAPIPRTFADEWTLGKPDYVVQLPKPIAIKATGTMPYQFVKTETTLAEDKWVQGYEILPTDRSVVHHVLVNVHEKGAGKIRDSEEGIGGYWAAYVPGNAGQAYPDGFARKLPAGATVSYQIHYTPSGEATEDQLKMGLIFAKSEPKYIVTTIPLADPDLNIPPGEANHIETITRPVPVDINVMAYMAHMHVRGKAFKFELTTPDGKTETLLDIPRYDFNWQLRYDYREPKVIPKGSRVKVTAVFDNSDGNPANPDSTKTVHWGQQTYEEMLIGYVETYAPVGEQKPTMRSGNGPGAAMFTALDADGDQMISKEEARRAIERVPQLKQNPAIMELLFARVDTDGDGKLSPEEFEELRKLIRNGR